MRAIHNFSGNNDDDNDDNDDDDDNGNDNDNDNVADVDDVLSRHLVTVRIVWHDHNNNGLDDSNDNDDDNDDDDGDIENAKRGIFCVPAKLKVELCKKI